MKIINIVEKKKTQRKDMIKSRTRKLKPCIYEKYKKPEKREIKVNERKNKIKQKTK